MPKDYSNKNLQNASLKNMDLSHATFAHSDLRGANLSGSNLTEANFENIKTGITPFNMVWIFVVSLAVSALSGYIAMLTGTTIQAMVYSTSGNVKIAGITSIVVIVAFIAYAIWKGVLNSIKTLIIPIALFAIVFGIIAVLSHSGSGEGVLYMILSLVLVVVMFVVGTVARAAAGSLSNIIFIIVGLFGGIFGRNIGGGIGTVIMAISCLQISKRALSGAEGFAQLRKVAFFITRKYGTSFRDAKLAQAHFSGSKIRNADFSGVDMSFVDWGDSKKTNCMMNDKVLFEKKEPKIKVEHSAVK